MASKEEDELAPYVIQELELLQQGQEQGAGSYGAVYRVKVRGFPCIAKRLHAILLGRVREVDVSDRERAAIQQRFREECILLSKLRHPHIVQFIGVRYGRTPEDLTLVMEYLHTDLEKCLRRCSQDEHIIPLPLQLGILLDVSYGLLYLHSQKPPIIHRDLKASNILLMEDMRAKLADLGVSKILDLHPMSATAQTVCPGTLGVMPPEALVENPQYDAKLDDFSYGTLALHIVNHEFAMPFEVPNARRGEVHIARRRRAIEKMGADHCLYDLVIRCLQDDPRRRPTTAEICATLEQLSRQHPKQFKDVLELYAQLDQLQLHQKMEQEAHMLELKRVTQELHDQIRQKELECSELIWQIQDLQQNEEETLVVSLAKTSRNAAPHSDYDNSQLDYQPCEGNTHSFQFSWECHANASSAMARGASAMHGNMVYFSSDVSYTICSYHIEDKVWAEFPPCPVSLFGLEVINGLVTTVGGCKSKLGLGSPTRSLYTFTNQWEKQLPPMSTGHQQPATVQSDKFLVVAGGVRQTTVEVMNTETVEWSVAAALPKPINRMSTALCNDQLYLLGGEYFGSGVTHNSFTCHVPTLLASCNRPTTTVWKRVADVPLYGCTGAAVKGEVLAIGGRSGWEWSPKSDIYHYDPSTNSWELIGHLPSPRYCNFAVVLPGEKLMVVGGWVGANATDIVEVGELSHYIDTAF